MSSATASCPRSTRARSSTRSTPSPLHNVRPSETDAEQRARLAFIADLDREFLRRTDREARVEAAIDNYETAYRMQTAVPELTDLRGETEATKRLYGLDSPNASTAAYGRQCLVARRLVERGVRFIELTMVGTDGMGQAANPWDQHTKLEEGHAANAVTVDQPVAGLVKDLRSRGLLDETLVIFSGEFGRTPFVQGTNGRDHNPYGFSLWLAAAAASGRASSTAGPTSTATAWSRTPTPCAISTPRCCTCWASTTRPSPTASAAATSA